MTTNLLGFLKKLLTLGYLVILQVFAVRTTNKRDVVIK